MKQTKLRKLSNKKLIEKALTEIEEQTKFHITDIQMGDTYFLIEGPRNSICHFHIKEIPGFIFGLWNVNRFDKIEDGIKSGNMCWAEYLQVPSKSELIFFTQYERDVDKFKPSASGFVTGIYRQIYTDTIDGKDEVVEEFELTELIDKLTFMKKHPIKSFVYVGNRINSIVDELSGFKCLKIYINSWYLTTKYIRQESRQLKSEIKVTKKFINKLSEFNYLVRDYGDCCNPRIHILLRRKQTIDYDRYKEQLKLIEDFENNHYWYIPCALEELTLDGQPYTSKEQKEDNRLQKQFNEILNSPEEELTFGGQTIILKRFE